MVTACQVLDVVFSRKVQYAVGPPELSQTDPPVTAMDVHGRPRGPKVAAVIKVSVGETGVVAGSKLFSRLVVLGALAAGSWATSDDNTTSGSPETTEAPRFPEAPELLFGSMSTYASWGEVPEGARI